MNKTKGLAFVVMLAWAGCVSDSTYKQEEKKADALSAQDATYRQLDSQLKAEVRADQVQIQQMQNQLKVTIVNQILFPEGGWELDRDGEQTLDKIIPTLKTLEKERIEIDGFTDNVPIGPELKSRFPSNWELSTARATDVVRYLTSKGVDPNLLSATGFGDTQPVASNDTPQGRAKNRRIEIVLKPAGQ
ncbi:MAG: flagellar motor protein MotB [Myxococcaceae bacterium]